MGFSKTIETVAKKTPEINKAGIDDTSVLPSAVEEHNENRIFLNLLLNQFDKVKMDLDPYNWEIILTWNEKVNKYKNPVYTFKVRDREIKMATHTSLLSHSQIPKIALPKYQAWGGYFCVGVCKKMFLENFLLPLVCILLSVRVKILLVCLQVKVDQSERTSVFIM